MKKFVFAIVGALGALVAFLDSDMFKNMKEKYIDPLTESFGNLFASLGKIGDGSFFFANFRKSL